MTKSWVGKHELREAAIYSSIEAAQNAMAPGHRTFMPQSEAAAVYEDLYQLYRAVYFSFGDSATKPQDLSSILRKLREIAAKQRK